MVSVNSKESNEKRCQFWKRHLKTWSKSGLTQNAYCRNNNLKPNRFTYWKNKFKRKNLPVQFVQITPDQVTEAISYPVQNCLRLNIESRFQIEIPDGFSQTTLTKVLLVLGQV